MKPILIALLSTTFLFGCDKPPVKDDPATYGTPKTSYGEAVNKARNLSHASDDRNAVVDKQAEDLKDE